jgi:tRNA threonylcarbamoyladenosine biosynthesis protein TsaE
MRLTHGPHETEQAGAELAGDLQPGDVVLVTGEMGAGKTTLVRGALRELGIEGPVTSPTFTIGRRYEGGRIPASHLDLYRLASLEDEDPTLLDDYVSDERVAFVEWPAVAAHAFPRIRARVTIEHAGGDDRRIEISPG